MSITHATDLASMPSFQKPAALSWCLWPESSVFFLKNSYHFAVDDGYIHIRSTIACKAMLRETLKTCYAATPPIIELAGQPWQQSNNPFRQRAASLLSSAIATGQWPRRITAAALPWPLGVEEPLE